jgi:precorrin-6A/cobalt-precorrin-6A reductase
MPHTSSQFDCACLKKKLATVKASNVVQDKKHKILILGGTADARQLAGLLIAAGQDVETSLAGVTTNPERPPGKLRNGGFGGPSGLRAYLVEQGFTVLIDATHPFASQMSANAVKAVQGTSVLLLAFERPAWLPIQGDDWSSVSSIDAAAAALPQAAKVFLAIGRNYIAPFMARSDVEGLLRMVEPPGMAIPPNWTLILARPPKSVAAEEATMRAHHITHLVCKNAGGAGRHKLDAARICGVQVIMVERPPHPASKTIQTLDAVITAILNQS